MKNFIIRTLSAIIFAAAVLTAFYFGKTVTFFLFGIFMTIILCEYKNFSTFKNIFGLVLYALLGVIFYFIGVYGSDPISMRQWGALTILFLIAFFMIISQRNLQFSPFVNKVSMFFYTVVPFIMFMSFFDFSERLFNGNSFLLPFIFIATIWIGDSFAYILGSIIGKHKMAPKISPAKTWEGFIGGLCAVILAMIIFRVIVPVQSYFFWILFGIIIYILGTFGDLTESMLKRKADLKDSGCMMPGHGGAFDRFDSFILAVPFTALLLLTFNI
ncbi:MAG: phosphatidate cytidylyltransferase [Bacteroidales bacterium]|nr:phosphatidate cytidylyltransferase [Bacteroidales bacterium]